MGLLNICSPTVIVEESQFNILVGIPKEQNKYQTHENSSQNQQPNSEIQTQQMNHRINNPHIRPSHRSSSQPNAQSPSNPTRTISPLTLLQQRLNIAYQIPATQEQANIHAKASNFGFSSPAQPHRHAPVCPCCLLPISTQELPMNVDTTPTLQDFLLLQSFYLDSTTALFFTLVKFTIIYLIALFITVSIFAITMSIINTNYCKQHPQNCGSSNFVAYSPAKQVINGHLFLAVTDLLNLIMVILSLFFFRNLRKTHRNISHGLKYHNQTQDDYSLLITNIPSFLHSSNNDDIHFSHKKALKQLMEQKVSQIFSKTEEEQPQLGKRLSVLQNFQEGVINNNRIDPSLLDVVKSVTLLYDLWDLKKIEQMRQQLCAQVTKEILQLRKKEERNSSAPNNNRLSQPQSSKKISTLNEQYLQLLQTHNNPPQNYHSVRFTGTAIISFEFQHYRNYLIDNYRSNPKLFTIDNKQLNLSYAPKPENIQWLNISTPKAVLLRQNTISCIVLIVLVAFFLVLMAALNQQQFGNLTKIKNPSFWQFLIIPSLIYLSNYLLRLLATYLNNRQQYHNSTEREMGKLGKYLLVCVANTTLLFYILSLVQGQRYLRNNGVVILTSYYTIPLGILSVLINLFSVDTTILSLFQNSSQPSATLQHHYNKQHQKPAFPISERYAYYLSILYLSVFYSYINPLCSTVTILIFFAHYWIDKYSVLKRSSSSTILAHSYSQRVLTFFQLTVFFFALGNFYYSWKIQGKITLFSAAGLALTTIYMLLVILFPNWSQKICCGLNRPYQTESYSTCLEQGKFRHNYWQCNPATMLKEEVDINREGEVVDYQNKIKLATWRDLVRVSSSLNQ